MKIKGLLFTNVAKNFDETMYKVIEGSENKTQIAESINSHLNEFVTLYEDITVNFFIKRLVSSYEKEISRQFNNIKIIAKEHKECFLYFSSFLITIDTIQKQILKHVKRNKRYNNLSQTDTLIISIYSYMMRLANQIEIMLLTGYSDGALRLWRTFYETAAIHILLMKEYNEDLSNRYIDHIIVNKDKKANSYQKHHESLGFPPIDNNILQKIAKKKADCEEKYGKEFSDIKYKYAWAKPVFPNKSKIDFRDIEAYANLNKLRPFYLHATSYNHFSFESFNNFFEGNKIYAAEIPYQNIQKSSLIDPMQLTVGVFYEVNILYLKLFSAEPEYYINLLMLQQLIEKLHDTFK